LRTKHKGFGAFHKNVQFENGGRIVKFLLKKGKATIKEVSKGTGLSTATIRKQVLRKKNLSSGIYIRTTPRVKGRVLNQRIRLVWLV